MAVRKQMDLQHIAAMQRKIDSARRQLSIHPPGQILFQASLGYGDDNILVVESDGLAGAVLRVVEGNFPVDFYTIEEKNYRNEQEAIAAAQEIMKGQVNL